MKNNNEQNAKNGTNEIVTKMYELIPDTIPKNISFEILAKTAYRIYNTKLYKDGAYTPAKDKGYIKNAISAIEKAIYYLDLNNPDISPTIWNALYLSDVKTKEETGETLNATLIEALTNYKILVLENTLQRIDQHGVKKYSQLRNKFLQDFANELTHNHGYRIDEARYAAGKAFEYVGIEVPGMSSEEPERRRILQSIMPNVTKPKKKN